MMKGRSSSTSAVSSILALVSTLVSSTLAVRVGIVVLKSESGPSLDPITNWLICEARFSNSELASAPRRKDPINQNQHLINTTHID